MSVGFGLAILSAGAQYKSAEAAEDAAKAQQQAAAVARRAQEAQASRQRRQLIRELRVKQAENLAMANATGTQGSSAVAGAQGALNSNFISALNYLDTQVALSTQQQSFLDQAMLQQAEANLWGAGSQLAAVGAKTIFDMNRNKT